MKGLKILCFVFFILVISFVFISSANSGRKIGQGVEDRLGEEEEVRVIVNLGRARSIGAQSLDKISKARSNQEIENRVLDGMRVIKRGKKGIAGNSGGSSNITNLGRGAEMISTSGREKPVDFYLKHKYDWSPSFSGWVTREGLEKLENNPLVKEVYLDKIMHIQLDESVPLIEADKVWDRQVNGINLTGRGQTVCVLDSGINYTHDAFNGEIGEIEGPHETPHPIDGGEGYVKNWTISKQGYSEIAVHFELVGLEELGYDYINITHPNGTVYEHIEMGDSTEGLCVNKSDFWSRAVPGDTINVVFYADGYPSNPANCSGMKLDRVRDSWSRYGDFIGGHDYCAGDESCSTEDYDPMDKNGHGTHVSGIITSDDNTYKGVAPNANILALKVMYSDGKVAQSDAAKAVEWCINRKKKFNISTISMSFGDVDNNYSSYCDPNFSGNTLKQAIDEAVGQNISVIAASGNKGWEDSVLFPACLKNTTTVGSANLNDDGVLHNRWTLPMVIAPGEGIMSTDWLGGFEVKSGTSMATPHASALAALMNQYADSIGVGLTPDKIEDIMNDTGKIILDSNTGRNYSRINASGAIRGIEDMQPETISITISGYPIEYGNIDAGSSNSSATDNGDYVVSVDSSTTSNVDIYHKGSDFTSANKSISVENMRWSQNSDIGSSFIMANNYSKNISNVAPGTELAMYYWLSIPEGQSPGENYKSEITISAAKHGDELEGTLTSSPTFSESDLNMEITEDSVEDEEINQSTKDSGETKTKESGGASVNVIRLN